MSRLRITRALLLLLSIMASTVMMADGVQPSTKNIGGKTYYAIQTAQHLVWFRDQVNNNGQKSINAEFENDIDLSTVCGPNVGNWTPICTTSDPNETGGWTGTFMGNNHSISNLYINSGNRFQALFGLVGGTIQDLKVQGTITLSNNVLYGAIVMVHSTSSAKITNVTSAGSVKGGGSFGGLTALAQGSYESCTNLANILIEGTGSQQCGGLFGSSMATASKCINEGKIEAVSGTIGQMIGGFAGMTQRGTFQDCINKGDITCGFNRTDAFCGFGGNIYNCLNLGKITVNPNCPANYSADKCYTLEGTYSNTSVIEDKDVTIVTATQLANGTVVKGLNASRAIDVWVQSGNYPSLVSNAGSGTSTGGNTGNTGSEDTTPEPDETTSLFLDGYINPNTGQFQTWGDANYTISIYYRIQNDGTYSLGNCYKSDGNGGRKYYKAIEEDKYTGNIILPNSIDGHALGKIEEGAFTDCSMSSIDVGGATVIDGAFKNCKNLKTVTATSLKTVTNNAFEGCDQLTSIPAITDEISNSAFKGCTSLSGDIELNAKTIKGSVFEGCSNISTIRLTQNVTSVSDNAFSGLSNLPALDMSKSKVPSASFGSEGSGARSGIALAGVNKSTLVYLPNGVNNTDVNCVNLNGTTYTCSQLELTDAHEFINLYSFTANKLSLDRTFTPNANSTVYLPFALAEADAKNLGEFYQFMGYSGGIANFCSISAVIANTPFLFKPKINKIAINHSVSVSASNVAGTGGQFTGTYKKIVWSTAADVANKYGYASTSSNGVAVGTFVRFGAGSWCNPFRAYLNLSDSAPAKINVVFNGETTGINEINSENENGRSYNLAGQLVGKSYKGIVIKNGKKVLK